VPETPLLKPQPRTLAPAPRVPGPAESEISSSRPAPQVHPRVGSAYAAYQAGDLASARSDYQQALREEPANRDALLGLAALDVRSGRLEAAEGAYLRLLQADPRDAHAQAALLALRAGRIDPVAAESRVKSMLADNPGAHVLNFTLGNQLAQQGRWAEAQQEYFKAFAAEPDNPDFAYNLAVSLDHLRQPKVALEYYRRALSLAKARGASFDLAAAQARVEQLGR
jgi:tetratricopeptide (TPR) repeat protein